MEEDDGETKRGRSHRRGDEVIHGERGGGGSQCPAEDRQVSCLNAHSSQLNPPTRVMGPTPHETDHDPQTDVSDGGAGGHKSGLAGPLASMHQPQAPRFPDQRGGGLMVSEAPTSPWPPRTSS